MRRLLVNSNLNVLIVASVMVLMVSALASLADSGVMGQQQQHGSSHYYYYNRSATTTAAAAVISSSRGSSSNNNVRSRHPFVYKADYKDWIGLRGGPFPPYLQHNLRL